MRRLRGDRRGVTVQIGAILLFGVLVLSLATYQAVAVPTQNERVEFNHNQVVQQDMLDLRSALGATTGDDEPRSVPVDLGTTFPARVLFVNPPPPGGALRTSPARTTTLGNAEAANPETRDYLDGSYAVDSRTVVYDPSYREYDAAPTTALEGPVAVNRGDNRSVAVSGQRLVEGRTLSLVVVRGNLSRAGTRPLTVDPGRVSETRRTTVRNASAGPLTVTVSTTLTAAQWSRLLADEPTVDAVAPAPGDAVTVSLAPVGPDEEPYTLRVGVVDVGSGAPAPAPRYLTSPDAPAATLSPGDEVTVSVRDRYNNPAAGPVTLTGGSGLVAPDDDATPNRYEPSDREDGVYRLRYVGGGGTLTASMPNVTGPSGRVSVTVTEAAGTGSVESGVTEGGTSTYSPSNRTFTLASPNGQIVGVSATDQYVVEDTRFTLDGGNGYDELESTVLFENANGERATLSLAYAPGNRNTVAVRTPSGGGSSSLTPEAGARLRDGDPVDLLDPDSYTGDPPLDEIRSLDDAGPVTVLVQDQRGRYDVTLGPESDGGDAASRVSLVSGSGTSVDGGGRGSASETVEFEVENGGSDEVTVTRFAVDSTTVSSARRVERTGDEVSGGGGSLDAALDIGGPSEAFDTTATVPGGGTATFSVGRFVNNGGNERDMAGETVTVTLTFADGSTAELSFTAS